MSPESFKELIDQYVTGSLSEDDRVTFSLLLQQPRFQALLEAELENSFMDDRFEGTEPAQRKDQLNKLILKRIKSEDTSVVPFRGIQFFNRRLIRMVAAAVFILALGTLIFLGRQQPSTSNDRALIKTPASGEIVPGHSGAILTLADGSRIVLDSLQQEKKLAQGSTEVLLKQDQLTYQTTSAPQAAVSYNTLTVPRGRQFQVVLPDGTRVWLNAATTLRYPTAFTGDERTVEITGEAYFEVTHDATKPFIVKKDQTTIRVLGTHFNVNAYNNEDSEDITLLEGSVAVKKGPREVTIKPGQQAQVSGNIKILNNVDMDEVVAWKEGKFQFGETADIKTVMHQVANWYDVDVVYKGAVTKHVGGGISPKRKPVAVIKHVTNNRCR